MIYKDTSRLLMHGVCTNVLADEVAEKKTTNLIGPAQRNHQRK